MSYEKTTWETGDVITAEKLNNIEDGIESAAGSSSGGTMLVVTYSEEGIIGTLDKTWNEIKAAFPNVIITDDVSNRKSTYICTEVYEDDGVYGVVYGVDTSLAANSADGYPQISYD